MTYLGAGGTPGGTGRFFLGAAMMLAGGYLFLQSIQVHMGFALGMRMFALGGVPVTSGMVLVPFIFGVGLIFYNGRSLIGWGLAGGALLMLGFGVLASVQMHLRAMSAFELLTILTLAVGGLGLLLSSLRPLPRRTER